MMSNQTHEDEDIFENEVSNLPNIYANTFSLGINATDISVVFEKNAVGLTTVSLPFSTAKSLINALSEVIQTYEKITNQQVLSLTDILELFEKNEKLT